MRAILIALLALPSIALGQKARVAESAERLRSGTLPDYGGLERLKERLSDPRRSRLEDLLHAL